MSSAIDPTGRESDALPFAAVLENEHVALFPPETRRERVERLEGLALSGGGIRSATFNLGLIEALLERGQLSRFDYLSTVSGGGYIGSWLTALIQRLGAGDVTQLEAAMRSGGDGTRRARIEAAIHFLRQYSNYLTPRVGWLGADTLTAVAIYTRNLMLNMAILVLVFGVGLLLPYPITGFFSWLRSATGLGVMLIAFTLLAFAAVLVGLGSRPPRQPRRRLRWTERAAIVAPLLGVTVVVASALTAFAIYPMFPDRASIQPSYFAWAALSGAELLLVLSGIAYFAWRRGAVERPVWEQERRSSSYGGIHEGWLLIIGSILAGAVGGMLVLWLAWLVADAVPARTSNALPYLLTGFGGPAIALVAVVAMSLQSGFAKRAFTEQDREWHGRLCGYILFAILVWVTVFGLFLGSAALFDFIASTAGRISGFLGWSVVTAIGVLIARSRATGGPHSRRLPEWVARVAPWIFIIGLAIGLELATHWIVSRVTASLKPEICEPYRLITIGAIATCPEWKALAGVGLAVAAWLGAQLLGRLVDINLFAFHQFYRNRLTRAYLGASHHAAQASMLGLPLPAPWDGRRAHDFTDLDPDDDLFLRTFAGEGSGTAQRPYPIINTTLNLAATGELAWQSRKAASFVFTPLYCGYQLPPQKDRLQGVDGVVGGYRPTAHYMIPSDGPRLGLALAISGAAVSPNAGYHTAPAVTFLLTVFNLRLGRWCGNPTNVHAWRTPSPRNAMTFLLRELQAKTSERSTFVYLSDGGHFENLGLYELVRRRCRRIVASDASADPGYRFADLADAIRKVRVDFNVVIEFDQNLDLLRPSTGSVGEEVDTGATFAVASVHYPETPAEAAFIGKLYYLKPTLPVDRSADIGHYASAHPEFPHETTADQWFDESQFESYRELGYFLGTKMIESDRWPD